MIYRYVYMIVCMKGCYKYKFYIGQHTTKNLDDGYKGSGTLLKKYYKKYPNDYIKTIIKYCNSQEELDKVEKEIIAQVLGHPDCLNIAKGGKNFVGIDWRRYVTEDAYKKHCMNISNSLKGHKGSDPTVNMSNEEKNIWKQKISLISKSWIRSEEQKQKQHDKMKNRYNGYKFMTDGYNVVFIPSELWGEYIDIGYKFGKNKYLL